MAEVWFWLVIMLAAICGVFAIGVHIHSGGARDFAAEMRGPKAEAEAGDEESGGGGGDGGGDAPTEAAAA